MTDLLPRSTRTLVPIYAPAALLFASTVGLLCGAGTSWLAGVLPGSWHVLADSGAVWTLVAFVLAVVCAGPRWLAVAAGAMALLCEVAGYYLIAASVQGFAATQSEQVLWTVAALWIGPLAGLAGHAARRGTPGWSLTGVLSVLGVLAGEGLHELYRVGDGPAGCAELSIAVAVGLLTLSVSRAQWQQRWAAVAAGVAVTVVTALVYGQAVLG